MSLTEWLEEQASERRKSYQPIVVSAFPDMRDFNERVIWGTFSWSLTKSKIRLIRRSTAVSCGHGLQTPGDVVRDYLDYYHPRRLRASAEQARLLDEHVSTPLFLRPTVAGDYTYVDIKAAYWSILQLVGWDVDYFPERWIGQGRIPHDFPLPDSKVSRACLVSMALPSTSLEWTGTAYRRRRTKNVHINRGLWRVVQDILHSIARAAVALDAVYVHTDGYILPTKNADTLREEIWSWGLPSSIKGQGFCLVLGFGNFKVGDRQSKRLKPIIGKPYSYVRQTPAKWLKPRITRFRGGGKLG